MLGGSRSGGRGAEIAEVFRAIRVVSDRHTEGALFEELLRPEAPKVLSFVNAHGINLCWSHEGMRKSLLQSDILLRDGVGMEIAMPLLGLNSGLNMAGTDLIPKLLSAYSGRRIALFGTRSPWLDVAARRVADIGGLVVAQHDGFDDPETYVELARRSEPDLVVLAMGMPKQEQVSFLLRNSTRTPCLIVNGGAILDFMSGRVIRAPKTMQRLRLEWLFRLGQEPRRLFNRYVVGNPLFLLRLATIRALRQEPTPQ